MPEPEPEPERSRIPSVAVAEEAPVRTTAPATPARRRAAAELATLEAVGDAPQPQTGAGVSWQPTAKRTLAASLARESVWRNVLKETVQVLGSEGGWDTVTAWLPDESDGLGCAATWAAHRGLDRFEALTWEAGLKRDGSLLDQALQAPHLTWLTDIDAVDDERLQTAAAHGMSSALLLPVRNGASTIGLLELLTHDSIEPDAQIALSLEASALQLGPVRPPAEPRQVVERQRLRRAVRRGVPRGPSGAHANMCSLRWSNLETEVEERARLPGYREEAVVRHFDAPEAVETRFYEVRAKSILNRVPEASQMPFRWTINPYRGCTHACTYCLRVRRRF